MENKQKNSWEKPTNNVLKIRDTLNKPQDMVPNEEHAAYTPVIPGGGKFIDDGPS